MNHMLRSGRAAILFFAFGIFCVPACGGSDDGTGSTDDGLQEGAACGSRGLGVCAEGLFCDHPEAAQCGAADAPGACTVVPEACTKEYAPVCGCDGTTYGNACMAAHAGVSVASQGECAPPEPTFCGGFAGFQCGEGEYCRFSGEHCGAGDMPGDCEPIPEACTEEYAPVCGCDDVTYGNACAAAQAGVSVQREGECEVRCGGWLGDTCAEDEFCAYVPGQTCGWADASAVCAKRPQVCTLQYAPVCGCDGTTYSNTCAAAGAGVGVLHDGPCPVVACGGLAGIGCAEGEYCKYEAEAACGAADMTGACTAVPEACAQYVDPVCGCDGTTYGNDCEAAVAGTSVAHAGACDDATVGG